MAKPYQHLNLRHRIIIEHRNDARRRMRNHDRNGAALAGICPTLRQYPRNYLLSFIMGARPKLQNERA